MDRSPSLIPLLDCADQPAGAVGRKARLLGWAAAGGLSTPGGLVLRAERFWAALDACGVSGQARFLQQVAVRLDPAHAVGIAAGILDALDTAVLEGLAAGDAEEAFDRLAAPRVICRSSAAMEDGRAAAFPGVFVSVLDIDGPGGLAQAIARCWRSAFSAPAIRYLLRIRAEPVDFSLALLLQRQVEAAWFGIYASVDPLTGVPEPLADLSGSGPDALVNGRAAAVRARRRDGRWDGAAGLGPSLEALHRAGARFAAHLGGPVDVEFALPRAGADPVILQCRPLTHAGGGPASPAGPTGPTVVQGRPCAGGRAVGLASSDIVLVDRLTPADYDRVLGAAGVVAEEDASPLSHAAILCRELGVPFVCGVEGARAELDGRRLAVDGHTGTIEILDDGHVAPAPPPPRTAAAPAISALELLLLILAEGRPGHPLAAEAQRVARQYPRVVPTPLGAGELDQLQRLGAGLFGPEFSAAALLADLSSMHVPEHHPPSRPGAARHG